MLKDVVFVQPLPEHHLKVRFEDGVEGIVDIHRYVGFTGVFAPLRDPGAFAQVRVNPELGVVEWECGADLDSDVLYAEITGQPVEVHGLK
ncbi:MAG: DUF2442 domain-containing protein [Candidatus Zixiibacteriota bacterium]|nr:MAG: DUF2442 domain-containing protein [candidate division Zixibacteria bacterium]